MNKVLAGVIAAFAATAVLSLLLVLKQAIGLLPQLEFIAMLTGLARNYLSLPATTGTGWLLHWLIGSAGYGVAIALIAGDRPVRGALLKGLLLGFVGWLAMMLVLTVLAGQGLFALEVGLAAPLLALALHLIFGAVLGAVFGLLVNRTGGPR